MKRLATLAGLTLASLIGAFAFTAPAHAATTCTSPTTGFSPNSYPQGFLYICESPGNTVAAGDVTAAKNALAKLGGVNAGANSNAKDTSHMATNNHYVYVFAKYADFIGGANQYCTASGNNTSSPPVPPCTPTSGTGSIPASAVGWTYTKSGGIWQSIIFMDRINGLTSPIYTTTGNTVAHEAGHQLDSIYGTALYGTGHLASEEGNEFALKVTGMKVTFSGSVITPGNVLNLSFQGTQLSSPIVKTHTVAMGDTLSSIAADFVSKINSDSTLHSSPILSNATQSGNTVIVTSHAVLFYSNSSTGTGGHAPTTSMAQSNYDFPNFDTLVACTNNAGIFSQQLDHTGANICSSRINVTVSGTVTVGDTIIIQVNDNAMSTNPHSFAYQVVAGDTTAKIATGLSQAINGTFNMDHIFTNAGITGLASGSVLRISSGTGNATTAINASSGISETITISSRTDGAGDTLSNTYSSHAFLDGTLRPAWDHDFTDVDSPLWAELFALETAIIANQTTPGNGTPDHYLGSGNFICSKNFVNALEKNGAVPGAGNFPYSTDCQ
ncbi:MAG: LysM peptidoglycan-binding domain-containing protein [Candidatus Obscuribacterales bacterium]|nr:LysM peptidoglycan-binding domain-containing protein [Candidatus Obscuribacterales bacterium]